MLLTIVCTADARLRQKLHGKLISKATQVVIIDRLADLMHMVNACTCCTVWIVKIQSCDVVCGYNVVHVVV